MNIFRSEPDPQHDEIKNSEILKENFEALENTIRELRQDLIHRRTMLKNVEKKLQEFQDTIYAMLIEEEYPRKKYFVIQDDDDDSTP